MKTLFTGSNNLSGSRTAIVGIAQLTIKLTSCCEIQTKKPMRMCTEYQQSLSFCMALLIFSIEKERVRGTEMDKNKQYYWLGTSVTSSMWCGNSNFVLPWHTYAHWKIHNNELSLAEIPFCRKFFHNTLSLFLSLSHRLCVYHPI